MAKYVGKIFRVNNTALHIKRRGMHYVHVKWYNPFTRKFRCNVITSLEDKKVLSASKRQNLLVMSYHKENDDTYCIFNRRKYEDLRNGKIKPIPVHKTSGFNVWSGYQETRDVHISALRKNEQANMKIKK